MKVRMKTIIAGPDVLGHPGQVIEVSRERALDLLKGNFAEVVEVEDVETATSSPAETTEGESGGKKKKKGKTGG